MSRRTASGCRHHPLDAEAVGHRPEVVAPEHLHHWHTDLAALGQPGEQPVRLGSGVGLDADMDVIARPQPGPQRFRRVGAHQDVPAGDGQLDIDDQPRLLVAGRRLTRRGRDVSHPGNRSEELCLERGPVELEGGFGRTVEVQIRAGTGHDGLLATTWSDAGEHRPEVGGEDSSGGDRAGRRSTSYPRRRTGT